ANSWAVNHLNSTGDLISQINLDDSNLRLQGEHIALDGDVSVHGDFTLDGSAHIRNGTIGTAQIANAAITDAKVSSLSVNSITGLTSQFVK
ncbi:gp58-like family protein, partial [Actinotignum timonense]